MLVRVKFQLLTMVIFNIMDILVLEIMENSSVFLIQDHLFYGFLVNSVQLVIILTMDTIDMNAEKVMTVRFLKSKEAYNTEEDKSLET